MNYDVILIHPPAIFDFRKKTLFPGALGSSVESIQFAKVPIGMLSMADYLDRHSFKVMIDNLADRMVDDKHFDVEKHAKESTSMIYAIGLHWHHHAQGAIEVARLYKRLHPDSLVVVGGLTATYFHQEIIHKYDFVDAVLRGEGEKPLLELVKSYKELGRLTDTPNLTCRRQSGDIQVTPLLPSNSDLDEFEFTRFDLLDPKTSVFPPQTEPRWSLVVCRGCLNNCSTCGGSAYSYKTYFGMSRPAFRSPHKIAQDVVKLNQQGIRFVGLYQDPRMGGYDYWKELMSELRRTDFNLERLSIDIFTPADEEFIREVATLGCKTMLYFCPESGDDGVRRIQGRCYSNDNIIDTVKICHQYHIPVQVFFSIGLSGETKQTIQQTWQLWDRLCTLDQAALLRGSFGRGIEKRIPIGGPISGPIILEPGALAFDFPHKYGYKLTYPNLAKYIDALSTPSWHWWLNHETEQLNQRAFLELIFESVEYSIQEREKYKVYNESQSAVMQFHNKADMVAIGTVSHIMSLPGATERKVRLKSLREAIDTALDRNANPSDPYGYKALMRKIIFSI